MPSINNITKTCKKCGIEKSTSEFYKQKQRGDSGQIWEYYDSICINCRKEYSTERRRALKKQAILYKGGKCIKCGFDDIKRIEVFDFHHRDASKKEFAIFNTVKSFKNIQDELDKCDLLCANCHRTEHAKYND